MNLVLYCEQLYAVGMVWIRVRMNPGTEYVLAAHPARCLE